MESMIWRGTHCNSGVPIVILANIAVFVVLSQYEFPNSEIDYTF